MQLDTHAWGLGLAILLFLSGAAFSQDRAVKIVTVAQQQPADFVGSDEAIIKKALTSLGQQGGVVRIEPGQYLIRSKIVPQSRVTISGTSETVLKLPSPVLTTTNVEKGAAVVSLTDTSEFAPGTIVEFCPPKGMESFPDSEVKQFSAAIAEVRATSLVLREGLPHDVPQGSRVGYANNVFEIRNLEKDVTVENLVIDGGRQPDTPMPGHVRRCAVLAHGNYSYEGGPQGPPIETLRVVNCHIRNCYGRAVAMYQVVKSEVRGCLIENIADEAIDFDHFCYYCRAVGNEVRNAVTGVTINDGSYCTVEYNRFTGCGIGVTIWWWYKCPQTDIDIENVIQHNFVFSPTRVGISIGKRCFRNQVIANFVEGGIDVVEPDNVVEHNTLR